MTNAVKASWQKTQIKYSGETTTYKINIKRFFPSPKIHYKNYLVEDTLKLN